MPIKPYSPRHSTDDLGDVLRISIPSRKQWFLILFMGFWLFGWSAGEFSVLGSLLNGQGLGGMGLFTIAWLAGWSLGGAFAIFILAWQLFGREVIDVSSDGITANRVVLGLGIPKEYAAAYIKALRVTTSAYTNDLFGWSRAGQFYGIGGGLLAFDYGAKTIRFGNGIDEAEAKQILSEIHQRFPQYRTRPNVDDR